MSHIPYFNYRIGLIGNMSQKILSLEQERHTGFYLYRVVETRISGGAPVRFGVTPWLSVRKMRAVLDGMYAGMRMLLEEDAVEDRQWIRNVFKTSKRVG